MELVQKSSKTAQVPLTHTSCSKNPFLSSNIFWLKKQALQWHSKYLIASQNGPQISAMGWISQAGLADIHPCGNLVLLLPTDNCRLTLNGPRTLSFRHGWIHFWLHLTFILRCTQNIFLTWLWCNRITQMALPYHHSLGNKELSLAWNCYACTSQLYFVGGSMVTTPELWAFNQSPLVKTTSVLMVKTGALFFLIK